jgi:predicted Zn finger-like uncharacterized protein
MDVQCERCKTEYEFDDALVSGRGTTVKCTNCGLQFKVRAGGDGQANERWTVRTMAGVEHVFTTLRELQRAISQRQVGRSDTLSRGNGPPRPLGSIAELEPFFRNSDRPVAPAAPPVPGAAAFSRDGRSAATAGGFPSPAPPPAHQPHHPQQPPRASASPISPFAQTTALPSQGPAQVAAAAAMAPARERLPTLRPPSEAGGAPPPPQGPRAHLAAVASGPPPRPPSTLETPAPMANPYGASPERTLRAATSTQPLPPQRPEPRTVEAVLPPTRPIRRGDPSFEDFDTSEPIGGPDPLYSIAPQRRRVGGWIVAVVLLLGVGLIGYRVGMPYLSSSSNGNMAATALDPRAAKFLTDGEHALEDGNLDLAKENFDKASALGEKDPHVLLDVAKLAAVRADVPWLKLRLLPETAEDDLKATKSQLADLTPGLRKAAEDAALAAPTDTAAARIKVDALRIAGEQTQARAAVASSWTSSQPETSYVLAALDLADPAPPWPSVLERLRTAAGAEGNLGRARAALVYALARSGDATGAKAELDRLAALSRAHPLVGALRAYLGRAPVKVGDAGVAAAGSAASPSGAPNVVDVNSLPHSGGGGGGGESADPRVLVQQGAEAENRGQFGRATKLYEEALRYDSRNSEALAGLGTVSLKQGDPATARKYFGQALAINPNYVPALVGQADALWQEGDKNGATAKYKDLVDRFPESAGYPSYVKTRAAGSSSGSAAPGNEAPANKPAAPPAKPGELTLPSNVPSDLPGTPR